MDSKKVNTKIIAFVLAIVIVGGGAFYAGMQYGKSKTSANGPAGFANLTAEQRQARIQQFGGTNGGGNRNGDGGFIAGEILAKDDKSITIKLTDGGSKIIFLSDTTEISKNEKGSKDDLAVGKQIMVNGDQNDDGSYNAKTIRLGEIGVLNPPQPANITK